MNTHITRRRVVSGGTSALLLATGGAMLPPAGRAQNASVSWAYLTPGFTVLIAQYIIGKQLAQKHNVIFAKPTNYAAVSTYYNDFAAGNYDLCIGSWDVFAARWQAGVPIQLLCTITTADMIFILAGDPQITDVAQLKGKTVAAVQSTGTYRIVSALIQQVYGLELGKDIAIQGVDNPAAAITLVKANRADGGLSWEPNISAGLQRDPGLHAIFNAGEVYRKAANLDFPYFGVGLREDWASKNPDLVPGVRETFKNCLSGLIDDTADAVKVAGQGTGFPAEVLADAIASKRLRFRFGSMTEEAERLSVVKASEFMVRHGLLQRPVDDRFFVMH